MKSVWLVQEPSGLPFPPKPMSFTALRSIESCPRQWAFSHAKFPSIWDGHGYPSRQNRATLVGRIVHSVLERISKRVVMKKTVSAATAIFETLKELGGISQMVEREIAALAQELKQNPRVQAPTLLENELLTSGTMMRQRVQFMLSRLEGNAIAQPILPASMSSRGSEIAQPQRSALAYGAHAEVELRTPDGAWYGKADRINISEQSCEIVDFKTGEKKEEHELQLRIYAYLWLRDSILNPEHRLADTLRIVYPNETQHIAGPSSAEIDQLETEMTIRAEIASRSVSAEIPVAIPSRQTCQYCQVRQLCQVYWSPQVQSMLAADQGSQFLWDAELQITGKAGEWTWTAKIVSCGRIDSNVPVLLRAKPGANEYTEALSTSRVLRILAAQVFDPNEDSDGLHVVSLTHSSEVFVMN